MFVTTSDTGASCLLMSLHEPAASIRSTEAAVSATLFTFKFIPPSYPALTIRGVMKINSSSNSLLMLCVRNSAPSSGI